MSKKYLPIIKLWDGTSVHQSLDTSLMSDVASKLSEMGFNAIHKGVWSYEELPNGKKVFVTHTRRLGGLNPYGISQRDAEKWMINMAKGTAPENVIMKVAAHGHTVRGTIDDEPFKVVNSPCWVTFQEYDKAMGNFEHFQTDIGAYFIFVTNEGRIRLQPWIYKPFVYNHHEGKNYEGHNDCKKFVEYDESNKAILEPYLKALVKNSKFIIAVTADYHCGHVSAIAPPQYTYGEYTRKIDQTPANLRIWNYWKNFVAVCKEMKVNELWVVGDACDGTNVFADKSRRMLTTNLDEQKAMFLECLKEFL